MLDQPKARKYALLQVGGVKGMTTMTTMTSMTTIKETETESDLDSNRNSCDVFDIGNGFVFAEKRPSSF